MDAITEYEAKLKESNSKLSAYEFEMEDKLYKLRLQIQKNLQKLRQNMTLLDMIR